LAFLPIFQNFQISKRPDKIFNKNKNTKSTPFFNSFVPKKCSFFLNIQLNDKNKSLPKRNIKLNVVFTPF